MIERIVAPMLREAEQRIQRWVSDTLGNLTARLVMRTILSQTSEGEGGRHVLVDAVEGFTPADGHDPGNEDVERLEYAGFLVIPVPKEPAVRLGDRSPVFHFPLGSKRYRPAGGKQGESCQYNLGSKQATRWVRNGSANAGRIEDTSSGGAKAVLDENGTATLDSNVAQNKDIVLNGGTLKVARVTDPVVPNAAFTTWMNAVDTAIKDLVAGNPVTPPGSSFSPVGLIDPNAGAAHVKG